MRYVCNSLLLLAVFLLFPVALYAHTTGFSHEATDNGYLIDIGYDPESPTVGDRMVLDFSLRNASTKEVQKYRDVWVRVQSGEELLLATGVAQASFGPTTLLLQVPKNPGKTLHISARFEDAEGALAETSFDIPVVPETRSAIEFAPWAGGAVTGALLVWLISERKKVVSLLNGEFFKVS